MSRQSTSAVPYTNWERAMSEGNAFATEIQCAAGAGFFSEVVIDNPANSGRLIIIYRAIAWILAAHVLQMRKISPNLGGANLPTKNLLVGAADQTNVAVVRTPAANEGTLVYDSGIAVTQFEFSNASGMPLIWLPENGSVIFTVDTANITNLVQIWLAIYTF